MARMRHRGRDEELTREALIEIIVKSWPIGAKHEALAKFPAKESAAIVAEAEEIFYERRWQRRRVTLLERLREWPASGWSSIFAEQPGLKDELTDSQRAQWQAWLNGRAKASPKTLAFPENPSSFSIGDHRNRK
jgi:hypothetical protein